VPEEKLARLKEATADAHCRVEEAVGLFQANERAGYERYLGRLLGFYEPFEPALEDALGDLPGLGLEERRKTPLLHQDLTWLQVDTRGLPRCRELPRFSTPARALGGLYVVEGATLGGRVQLRRLRDSLGISPTAGAAFLGCYGDDLNARWQSARETIAACARKETAVRMILAGASETFEAFGRWLRIP
jgi:heme oxygenase